jgi:hypothetical protein
MDSWFDVQGWWRPRQESTEALAQRLARFLTGLAAIDPLFGSWTREGMRHRSIVPHDFTVPPNTSELRGWLEENRQFEARDGRKAFVGYQVFAHAMQRPDKPAVSLRLYLTTADLPDLLRGLVALTILSPRSDLLSLRNVARPMLLALAEAWDVNWAGVATGDFSGTTSQPTERAPPAYRGGWMIYLKADDARRISGQDDVDVETLPNGGVLLTATEAVFDRHNEAHRGAAARIQASLSHLNGDRT